MLPFSKRPPPPEEYLLRSGDFQAVNAPPRQDAYANNIPPAHRAPVFARQAAHTPYGFSQRQQQQGHYGDLSVPPPPHSLAPVAMGSGSHGTGSHSHRAQPTVTIREKPSLKWGVMIALTGALLGGVLGLGMDAKRQQARAAAAADAAPLPPLAPTALPTAVAVNGLNAVPATAAIGSTLAGNGTPAAGQPAGERPATVLPPSAPLTVAATPATPAKPEPVAKNDKHAHAAPAPAAKHFVAVKIPKPAPEKVDAPAKPEKAETAAKTEKPAPAEKAEKAPTKGSSDARKVLEDAIKDTTNTL